MGKGKKGGPRKGGRAANNKSSATAASNKRVERATKRQLKKGRGRRFGDAEEREYEAQLQGIGGTIHHMASDGNCLFRSIADQLEGKPEDHMRYRGLIMEFIESHADDFKHFMEEDETWDDYVPRMKNEREWGGQHEIVAASRLFKCNVVVHQLNAPRFEVHAADATRTIHLSYHGESHYNSVRALDDRCLHGEPAKQWAGVASVAAPRTTPVSNGKGKKDKGKGEEAANGHVEQEQEEGGLEGEQEGHADAEKAAAGEGEGGAGGKEREEESPERQQGEQEKEAGADAAAAGGDKKAPSGLCPCGSGTKYRKCCRKAERQRQRFGGAGSRRAVGGGGGSEEEDEEDTRGRGQRQQQKKKKPPPASAPDPAVHALASQVAAIAM